LASANAQETVGLIQAVLAGQGIERRFVRSDRAIVVKYMRKLAGGSGDDPTSLTESEMEVSSAIRSSITLTPDVRTNTVIVRAPSRAMKMIEQMIADLDDATTGAQSIRIFKLVNADSEAMAGILSELFSLRQQGSLYVLKPREGRPLGDGTGGTGGAGGAAAPAPGDFGSELTAVPDERQQLSITVDTRTNSLLVSGSPTYLDLVQDVVQRLDAEDANERNVEVYALRNAVAEDVASVIGDFVDAEQRKLVETLGSDQLGSASRLLEREVTIVGDAKSNTVLVSASPRYMDRVMEMVRKLDVDPPQVLIQVLLAEVTLDSGNDWGVDANVDFSVGGADGSAGFGFASAFVAGTGVPSLAIASQDFQLLVRALKTQGRMAVLSNPTIMAANNETARLQVGDEIQVPTGNTLNADGQATSVEPRQLGVILDVLPSINPDGFVRLVITPEISLLSNRTTQISENFEAPVITKRTATTTVTVKDGQTIVIGGLISDRYERRDRKVPLLGDIPLIGALFSSTTEEFAKTELLIVLTPHVIYSPSNIARVNQVTADEIDRLTVPEAIKQDIRESLINGTGGIYDAKGNRIDFGGDKADYRHDWSRWDERKEPGPDRLPVQRAPDPATPDPKPVATPGGS
ncbi:MAG: hypothetical protein KDA25_01595, partial [Phycisphaerales bacterium]|nr:hypothetical protein [Phycisphaerales bacterium]